MKIRLRTYERIAKNLRKEGDSSTTKSSFKKDGSDEPFC